MPGNWRSRWDKPTDTRRHVAGEGPVPCRAMLIGERPGKEESWCGRPFVGASGKMMDAFLKNDGVFREDIYITNVVKYAAADNERPTMTEINLGANELTEELERVHPTVIGLVGATAVHQIWPDVDLEWGHGLARAIGGTTFLPMYHPAFGLRSMEQMPLVQDDFHQFCNLIKGKPVTWAVKDQFDNPDYKELKDGDAKEIARWFASSTQPVYVDTEGYHWAPWGLSYTDKPGWSRVIHRTSKAAIAAFRRGIRAGRRVVYLHNSLHDIEVLAGGLAIDGYEFTDTMVQSYHLCIEPQGLKPLARRYAGMEMNSYEEVIAEASLNKAWDYLREVQKWASKRYAKESTESSKTSKKKARKRLTSASAGRRLSKIRKSQASARR